MRISDGKQSAEGRLTLTAESRQELNTLLELSVKELKSFFDSSDQKASPRSKMALAILSHYSKLHQSENGAQRILIAAINCVVDDPEQRKAYIRSTMPLLNLVK